MTKAKEPKTVVYLTGGDGNASAILAACRKAAREDGWSPAEIERVTSDMRSGDYDHLLQVALREFDVR